MKNAAFSASTTNLKWTARIWAILLFRLYSIAARAASNGGPAQLIKNIGLVTDVFQHDGLGPLMGKKLLIGHVRYATSGATNVLNTQPLLMKFQ